MKYGIREIADFVFKAQGTMELGNRKFYKGEPVIVFDSLKTSSLEGATTTVYAQGGKGNVRLMAWDGDRTLTLNMEDALLSPESFAFLAGAQLKEASANNAELVHKLEVAAMKTATTVDVEVEKGAAASKDETTAYVMKLNEQGEIEGEPYLGTVTVNNGTATITLNSESYNAADIAANAPVMVDFYVTMNSGVTEINIDEQVQSHNFYMEGSTLWRDQRGFDHAANIIIPNGKVQSNFTLSMASTGDPSTFSFVVDAFPGMIKGEAQKKLAKLQILDKVEEVSGDTKRTATPHTYVAS